MTTRTDADVVAGVQRDLDMGAGTVTVSSEDAARLLTMLQRIETAEADIRADERRKVADLLAENAETLTGFAVSPERLVELIVFLLRLPGGSS